MESRDWLGSIRDMFRQQRQLAERAAAQVEPAELFRSATPDGNSIAVLLKHVGGNLRSRWTEPFTTDGEKPDRDRDSEFVAEGDDVASIQAVWQSGWTALDATLASLSPGDLHRTVTIRGVGAPLHEALLRSLAHTAQHAGQVVLLARQWRGDAWQSLSIPRGRSADFLRRAP
jgi:hypothetical protein